MSADGPLRVMLGGEEYLLASWRDLASLEDPVRARQAAAALLDEEQGDLAELVGSAASSEDAEQALTDMLVAQRVQIVRLRQRPRALDAPEVVNLSDLVDPEPLAQTEWLSVALVDDEFVSPPGEFRLSVAGRQESGRSEDGTHHERELARGDEAEIEFERIELPIRPRPELGRDEPDPEAPRVVPRADGPGGEEPDVGGGLVPTEDRETTFELVVEGGAAGPIGLRVDGSPLELAAGGESKGTGDSLEIMELVLLSRDSA